MEKEPEIWKPIPGYEGLYEVSNHGRVKSLDRLINHKTFGKYYLKSTFLKLGKRNDYYYAELSKNNKRKKHSIHRLVADNFIYNFKKLKYVNHIDGNRLNNYFKNLEWVNSYENISHFHSDKLRTSKFIGVYFKPEKKSNNWCAQIGFNGIRRHLGYFDTEEEAHQAYLDALKRYNLKNKYATKPPE